MTDLNDDERAALQQAIRLFHGYQGDQPPLIEDEDAAIWRAAGRYYREQDAKLCDELGNRPHVTWPMTQAYDECAEAIRKRIEGTTA